MVPSEDLCLVTALSDPDGELLEKADAIWPELNRRFAAVAVHVTTDTCDEWLSFLTARAIPMLSASPNWDHIGLHRRRALTAGVTETSCSHFLYVDPDHILRWVERLPAELDQITPRIGDQDCLVIGRSSTAFDAAPERLRATEAITNRIYALISGHDWDVMMAARGFSRRAAELIVAESTEDTLGNDVAWPLLVQERGFDLGYLTADGLTYETNIVYARDVPDEEDADAGAWMLRVYTGNQHVDAMRPFLGSNGMAPAKAGSDPETVPEPR